jgi:S1-C subfamily serine protease
MKIFSQLLVVIAFVGMRPCFEAGGASEIPIAAPMTTELAGQVADVAIPSVFRIICTASNSSGTGFLHKSGVIVTADHVIKGSTMNDIAVVTFAGQRLHITNILHDASLHLAVLMPTEKLTGRCLHISTNANIKIGMQVSTWGFHEGYRGLTPLLTCGYISGKDFPSRNEIPRIVVNAAFNRGNSGGPLVEIENGTVIGVVCSKLAPLPREIELRLEALKKNKFGLQYTERKPDGATEELSEGQLVEDVLQYLRSQTQLVVGYACFGDHLSQFLKANGIDP